MTRKELISYTTSVLRDNDIRKPVKLPKQTFHISDDEGNQKDFIVRKSDKNVIYTVNDVENILDALVAVVTDAIKRGDSVSIQGFGSLGVHKRAARATKIPETDTWVEVPARYVPKFKFGNDLRMAAKMYEMSLDENHDYNLFPEIPEELTEEPDGGEYYTD